MKDPVRHFRISGILFGACLMGGLGSRYLLQHGGVRGRSGDFPRNSLCTRRDSLYRWRPSRWHRCVSHYVRRRRRHTPSRPAVLRLGLLGRRSLPVRWRLRVSDSSITPGGDCISRGCVRHDHPVVVPRLARPPNKALQRTRNSLIWLTVVVVWRHSVSADSGPLSAGAGR